MLLLMFTLSINDPVLQVPPVQPAPVCVEFCEVE